MAGRTPGAQQMLNDVTVTWLDVMLSIANITVKRCALRFDAFCNSQVLM